MSFSGTAGDEPSAPTELEPTSCSATDRNDASVGHKMYEAHMGYCTGQTEPERKNKLKKGLTEEERKEILDKLNEIMNLSDPNLINYTSRENQQKIEAAVLAEDCDEAWEVLVAEVDPQSTEQIANRFTSMMGNRGFGRGFPIDTLEESLRFFGFTSRFRELETSLEGVRMRRRTKEDHEREVKRFEKDMLKLSNTYHPDKVKNRKGTEDEMAHAQHLQTALNATRKIIIFLTQVFLEDIDIDHKYSFFTNLNISMLGNEDDIENYVYEILFKTILISEIKQEYIIAEIRKFLAESHFCIKSFILDNDQDFEKYRSSALFRLKSCVRGYTKLLKEYEDVERECEKENLDNVASLIREMKRNCLKHLNILNQLLKVSENSLKGEFQILKPSHSFESSDDYFVSPFVRYTNIMLMCSVMLNNKEKHFWSNLNPLGSPIGHFNWEGPKHEKSLHHLAAYYGGNKSIVNSVRHILKKYNFDENDIKEKFIEYLIEFSAQLKEQYKIDYYNANSQKKNTAAGIKKCLAMKAEFEERKKDLITDFEGIKKSNEKMNQQVNKAMQDKEECNKQYEQFLKENSVVMEILKHSQKKKLD